MSGNLDILWRMRERRYGPLIITLFIAPYTIGIAYSSLFSYFVSTGILGILGLIIGDDPSRGALVFILGIYFGEILYNQPFIFLSWFIFTIPYFLLSLRSFHHLLNIGEVDDAEKRFILYTTAAFILSSVNNVFLSLTLPVFIHAFNDLLLIPLPLSQVLLIAIWISDKKE